MLNWETVWSVVVGLFIYSLILAILFALAKSGKVV